MRRGTFVTPRRLAVIASIGLLLLVTAATALSGIGDPGRSPQIGDDDAVARALNAAGVQDSSAKVVGMITTANSRAFRVSGKRLEAAVDVATGEVGLLTLTDHFPTSATVTITPDAAIDVAQKLIARLHLNAPSGAPEVAVFDHGSAAKYRVTWTKRVNGAVVPDQVVVSVNPSTGHWFAVTHVSRAYKDPPRPMVSLSVATATGQRTLGLDAPLEQSDLVVIFSPDGTQQLVWNLQFVDEGPGGYRAGRSILVDAMSGEPLGQ